MISENAIFTLCLLAAALLILSECNTKTEEEDFSFICHSVPVDVNVPSEDFVVAPAEVIRSNEASPSGNFRTTTPSKDER